MTYPPNPSHPAGTPQRSPRRRTLIATIIIVSVLAVLALGVYVNMPPEYTPQQWQLATDALKAYVGRWTQERYGLDSSKAHLDFFLSEGKWCTAVISAKTDAYAIVACYVGELDPPRLYFDDCWPTAAEGKIRVAGESLRRYDSLLAVDSCWLYFDTVPYWGEHGLKAFWKKTAFNSDVSWHTYSSILLRDWHDS